MPEINNPQAPKSVPKQMPKLVAQSSTEPGLWTRALSKVMVATILTFSITAAVVGLSVYGVLKRHYEDVVQLPINHGVYIPPSPSGGNQQANNGLQYTMNPRLSNVSVKTVDFKYPYQVSWADRQASYQLTKVSVGTFTTDDNKLVKLSGDTYNYAPGERVNAVVLTLKVTASGNGCVELNMRMLDNEGGLIPPNTRQFIFPTVGGCSAQAGTTYSGQDIVFVVDPSQKRFTFQTGGQPQRFTVTVGDNFITAVPELASGAAAATSQDRDAKRLSDVKQIATALELYYNDTGSYPSGVYVDKLPALVPKYIAVFPAAPQPADGTCDSTQNNYHYQGDANSYTLSFCLGSSTNRLDPGVHVMSQNGIQ